MELLSCEQIAAGHVPEAFSGQIEAVSGGLTMTGNPTGASDLFLHASPVGLAIATTAREIVEHLRRHDLPVALERESICYLLQVGFVVYPRTIFAGVFLLGIGDVAHVTVSGGEPRLRFEVDFPYSQDKSSQQGEADLDVFRDRMAQALVRATEGAASPVLLMSSGKDSTAAAMAAAGAGLRDLQCLTFVAGVDSDEHLDARRFCDQLGLKHEAVPLPTDPDRSAAQLLELYRAQHMPCADYSQLAYHACLVEAGVRDGRVLDGAGNDVYMGHIPSKRDMTIIRYSLGRNALSDLVRPLVDHASRANFFLQTRTETMFPGYGFRHRESRRFFESSMDTTPFWKRADAAYAHRDIFDLRAAMRGRHYDQGAMVLKAKGSVQARASTLRQPFTDPDVVDFYFQLPRPDRFDGDALVNKITLRKLLRREIGYDDAAIGKRIFAFDAKGFLQRNRTFVREQIFECPLWTAAVRPLVDDWYGRLDTRPRFAQALLAMLGISGWLNHAEIVGRPNLDVVDTPMDATP